MLRARDFSMMLITFDGNPQIHNGHVETQYLLNTGCLEKPIVPTPKLRARDRHGADNIA